MQYFANGLFSRNPSVGWVDLVRRYLGAHIAAIIVCIIVVAPVSASGLSLANSDLLGGRILGADPGDQAGVHVSGAGDVNGDGIADVIVSASGVQVDGVTHGASYVMFGPIVGDVGLTSLDEGPEKGFRIEPATAGTSPIAVSAAGDINGDGLMDVLVGAYGADISGARAGAGYVVFGKADGAPVSLATLGSGGDSPQGFRMLGAAAGDRTGWSISGLGDVNGDDLADIAVGMRNGFNSASFVVFGKLGGEDVHLSEFGAAGAEEGFRIEGASENDFSGYSVSGAGDVNGDGLADIVVGSPGANESDGGAYIVFGKADSQTVNLADFAIGNASGGFQIVGAPGAGAAGTNVSGAGDVNRDGLADVIIGAPEGSVEGNPLGLAYVVFGKPDARPVRLSDLAEFADGFRIIGPVAASRAGSSVAGAGDVNADGLADLIVGAPHVTGASIDGGYQMPEAGAAYIVFGKGDGNDVALDVFGDDPNAAGFQLHGAASNDRAGGSVSGAGDTDGDGMADLVVGAYGVNQDQFGFNRGAAYVVAQESVATSLEWDPMPHSSYFSVFAVRECGHNAQLQGVGVVGDQQDVSSPASRLWIRGCLRADALPPPPVRFAVGIERSAPDPLGLPADTFANVAWAVYLLRADLTDAFSHALVGVRYTDSEIAGMQPEDLRLVRRVAGAWVEVEGSHVDTQRQMVFGRIPETTPSLLALRAIPAPDPTLDLAADVVAPESVETGDPLQVVWTFSNPGTAVATATVIASAAGTSAGASVQWSCTGSRPGICPEPISDAVDTSPDETKLQAEVIFQAGDELRITLSSVAGAAGSPIKLEGRIEPLEDQDPENNIVTRTILVVGAPDPILDLVAEVVAPESVETGDPLQVVWTFSNPGTEVATATIMASAAGTSAGASVQWSCTGSRPGICPEPISDAVDTSPDETKLQAEVIFQAGDELRITLSSVAGAAGSPIKLEGRIEPLEDQDPENNIVTRTILVVGTSPPPGDAIFASGFEFP